MNIQLSLFKLEGYSGKVIRNEFPYVKLLTEPEFVHNRWEAIAQVEGSLALIEVTVKEFEWKLK